MPESKIARASSAGNCVEANLVSGFGAAGE
jgi:hypothetical protein